MLNAFKTTLCFTLLTQLTITISSNNGGTADMVVRFFIAITMFFFSCRIADKTVHNISTVRETRSASSPM